jgi:Uma2 family endonuclease
MSDFLGAAAFGTPAPAPRQGQEGSAMSSVPKRLIAITYEDYAQEYLRKLPLEHFMEGDDQATQRAITLASLALLKARRNDFHVFNEMLVQYPLGGRKKRPGQVVPDNMVVVSEEPLTAETSFNTPVEPAGPFWVMAYVSKRNKRKDYEDSFRKYEQGLKVPYYLVFYPETQDLTLYRHTDEKYVSVKPNEQGRYAVPEVEMEVALLDGWVRFWHKGELLLLPAELQRGLDEATRQATAEKGRADREKARADREKARADALEAELARLRSRPGQRGEKDKP